MKQARYSLGDKIFEKFNRSNNLTNFFKNLLGLFPCVTKEKSQFTKI